MKQRASTRKTVVVLRAGSVLAGATFLVGLLIAALKGNADGAALNVTAIGGGLLALDPRAWLSLAVVAMIGTPAAGLLVTAAEYREDRRSLGFSIALLGVLAVSVLVAMWV